MTICDFDMIFRYVVVGWEGTTHDSRVLTETICIPQHNFPMPPSGKYFVTRHVSHHSRYPFMILAIFLIFVTQLQRSGVGFNVNVNQTRSS